MTTFEAEDNDCLTIYARGHGEPARELAGLVIKFGKQWDAYWRVPTEAFHLMKVGSYRTSEKAVSKIKTMVLVQRGELVV